MAPDFKAVQEWLDDQDDVPDYVREAFDGSALRKQVEELNKKWNTEAAPAIQELAQVKRAPKVEQAFKEVGRVDWDNLRPAEKRIIEVADVFTKEGEIDNDRVATLVSEFGLPTKQEAENTDQPAAAQFAGHAASVSQSPVTATDLDAQIAKAEADGNVNASIGLKALVAEALAKK